MITVSKAKENVREMVELGKLLPNVVEFSLQSQTLTLDTGQTCVMSDFAYDLIKLTLRNIQMNHQELVIGMATDAYKNIVAELLECAEELK